MTNIKKNNSNEHQIKGDLQNDVELSLDQTHHAMKAFKSEQKSIFDEVMKHIASDKKDGGSYTHNNKNHLLKDYIFNYKNLNQENISKVFSLFQFNKNRNEYDKFIYLTKKYSRK